MEERKLRDILQRKSWKFETAGPDGLVTLFGVNIFAQHWQSTGESVDVLDPLYHQKHWARIYKTRIGGHTYEFAAAEFSNCMWGFYLWK